MRICFFVRSGLVEVVPYSNRARVYVWNDRDGHGIDSRGSKQNKACASSNSTPSVRMLHTFMNTTKAHGHFHLSTPKRVSNLAQINIVPPLSPGRKAIKLGTGARLPNLRRSRCLVSCGTCPLEQRILYRHVTTTPTSQRACTVVQPPLIWRMQRFAQV